MFFLFREYLFFFSLFGVSFFLSLLSLLQMLCVERVCSFFSVFLSFSSLSSVYLSFSYLSPECCAWRGWVLSFPCISFSFLSSVYLSSYLSLPRVLCVERVGSFLSVYLFFLLSFPRVLCVERGCSFLSVYLSSCSLSSVYLSF